MSAVCGTPVKSSGSQQNVTVERMDWHKKNIMRNRSGAEDILCLFEPCVGRYTRGMYSAWLLLVCDGGGGMVMVQCGGSGVCTIILCSTFTD